MIFSWSDEADAAFEKIKKMFVSASILMQFDPDCDTLIETDLSDYVMGGLLQQYNNNRFLCLCAFFFWKNLNTECNYKIYNKKLLAIVECLKK